MQGPNSLGFSSPTISRQVGGAARVKHGLGPLSSAAGNPLHQLPLHYLLGALRQ